MFGAYLKTPIVQGPVIFVADTGCARTTISGTDATKLRVNFKKLGKGEPSSGIGGTLDTWKLKEVTLTLREYGGGLVNFRLDVIDVLKPTAYRLPSLLGIDILQGSKFILGRKYCFIEKHNSKPIP